ncbi:MAG: multidrug effflux MFS transporter [Lysinibacillus sp.]|nr:multidrug effflux MFS transporter [Lysinibacillus sp.]
MEDLQNLNEQRNRNFNTKPLKLAAILGSLGAFAPLSIDMYLPALPLIAEELSTTQSSVQLSLTFFLFGLVVGQLLLGPISDAKGRRKPLLIGLALYTVSSLLCVFASSIEVFIGLRFIQGLTGASGIVLSRAILRDFFSGSKLTKVFAMLALIQGSAPVLAPVLGGIVLLFAPWKGVFLFLTIVGFVMFLIVLFLLPESLDESLRTKGSILQTFITFKQLLVDRSFIGFALAIAFMYAMMFAYISGSSFVLQNLYGVSAQVYSLIFAINGIGIVTCSQITGRLVGRFNEMKLLVTGILMSFFGTVTLLIMLIVEAPIYFILPPLFIAISSVGIVNTTGQSLALQNQGKIAGSASALLGVLQYILAGTIAPLTGLGSHPAISMGVVMVIGSIGAIVSYLLLIRLKFLKYHQEARSESM